MSDFRFSLSDLFKDFDTLMNTTASEQTKQISPYVGANTNLLTTQSENKDFDPTNTTIFGVSEIFQNIPAFQNQARVEGSMESALSKNLSPRIGGTLVSHAADLSYFKALIPEDVSLEGTSESGVASTDPNSPASTGPEAPFTGTATQTPRPLTAEEKSTAQAVINHPNKLGITANAQSDLTNGKISPFITSTLKFLMDRGVKLWITCLETGHSVYVHNTNRVSLHGSGRAVDIRPTSGSGSIASAHAWVDQVYQLLDTRVAPMRPEEVGGPYVFGTGKSSGSRTDAKKTYWFTNADHQNHVHIGIREWGPQ